MKIITITDIHGQYTKLKKAIKKAKSKGYDKLVFLGDYFDRGSMKENLKTIQWVLKHYQDKDKIFLMGNHDLWCYDYVCKGLHLTELYTWTYYANGGGTTVDAIELLEKKDKDIKLKLNRMYKSFGNYYINGNHIFTHGGLDIKKDHISVQKKDIWGDSIAPLFNYIEGPDIKIEPSKYFQNKTIVLGHRVVWRVDKSLVPQSVWDKGNGKSSFITKKDLDWNRLPLKLKDYNIYLTDVGVHRNDIPLLLGIFFT